MTRRTLVVRASQLGLLAVWGWLLVRPVWAPMYHVYTFGRRPDLGQYMDPRRGDPIPWMAERTADRPDEAIYQPDKQSGGWWASPNLAWKWDRDRRVLDPFAPLVGLMLALAVPPALYDRLTGPRRWNRWLLVAVAAATGGLLTGSIHTALTGEVDRGLIGFAKNKLWHLSAASDVLTAWHELRRGVWYERLPPATLSGLVVGGLTAAGALQPWRRRA